MFVVKRKINIRNHKTNEPDNYKILTSQRNKNTKIRYMINQVQSHLKRKQQKKKKLVFCWVPCDISPQRNEGGSKKRNPEI